MLNEGAAAGALCNRRGAESLVAAEVLGAADGDSVSVDSAVPVSPNWEGMASITMAM